MKLNKVIVYIMFFVAFCFLILVSFYVYKQETNTMKEHFIQKVDNQIELLNREILLNIEALKGITVFLKVHYLLMMKCFQKLQKKL